MGAGCGELTANWRNFPFQHFGFSREWRMNLNRGLWRRSDCQREAVGAISPGATYDSTRRRNAALRPCEISRFRSDENFGVSRLHRLNPQNMLRKKNHRRRGPAV